MEIYIAGVEGLKEEKVFCAMQEKITEERRRSMENTAGRRIKSGALGRGCCWNTD